jgi:hypothetical protein
MRRLGHFLMGLGAATGIAVAFAMFAHLGIIGVPWLVNVALAKFGLVTALGLMTGGAVTVRLGNRYEQRRLSGGEP